MTNKILEKENKNPTIRETESLNKNYILTNKYQYQLSKIDTTKDFLVAYQFSDPIKGEYHRFQAYDSYEEFMNMFQSVPAPERRWMEIIPADRPVPEYYDLDAKITDKTGRNIEMFNYYKENNLEFIIDSFKHYRKDFIESFYPLYNTTDETFCISESCDKGKFSLHIVVRNGLCFKDTTALKIFIKDFDTYLETNSQFVIDLKVYNKNQCMRLLDNTKYNQNRFLKKISSCSKIEDKLFLFSHILDTDTIFEIKKKEKEKIKKVDIEIKPLEFDDDEKSLIEKLNFYLPLVKNNYTYSNWSLIGQVIFNVTEGSDNGLNKFLDWSSSWEDYDEDSCITHWNKYKISNLNIGVIINQAKEDNPETAIKHYWAKKYLELDSDHECSKIFAANTQGEIFYTNSFGWIIYKNNIWTYNNKKEALIFPICRFFTTILSNYTKDFSDKFYAKPDKTKEEETLGRAQIKALNAKLHVAGSSKFATDIIKQLQAQLTEPDSIMNKFDSFPNLIAFSDSKVVDLNNGGKVRPVTKEDFIMTHTGYPYPPKIQKDLKYVLKVINTLSHDKDQIKSILSALSLCLYGENLNEVFIEWTGSGGNGKGLLDKMLQAVLGNYYKSISSTQLTEYQKDNGRANSELASCKFARCVMATEPEDYKEGKIVTLKIPIVKQWTGRDPITARFLHKDSFTFSPHFVLMLQLNKLIGLSTFDEAIQRRMKVIELPFKFVNSDKELEENEFYKDETLKTVLVSEQYRNAFFHILLDTWLENKGKFFESNKVKSTTAEFFDSQNPVKNWFNENYELDKDSFVSTSDLFNEFKLYDDSVTLWQFSNDMKKTGAQFKRTAKARGYLCKKISHNSLEYLL
jgi:P4 family phage/plasmid primase-like protien